MTVAGSSRLGREAGLVLALLVLLAAGLALETRGGAEPGGHPGSSFATRPDGCKALYLLLEGLGHRVERSFHRLGDFGAARVAFVLAPEVPLDGADLAGLRSWVERGGTLVYGASTEEPSSRPLRDLFGVEVRSGRPARIPAGVAADFGPARRVSVARGSGVRKRGAAPGALAPVASDGPEAEIAAVAIGAGRVIAIADASAASNQALAEEDNAVFFATLAAPVAGKGAVAFDEWSHGYGGAASVLHLDPVFRAVALALAALSLLTYAAAAGRRLGPASPEPPPARPASIAQVDALAAFYRRARSRGAVRAALGLPDVPVRSDAELLALARRLPAGAERR